MTYYSEKRKIAKELNDKLSLEKPKWNKNQVELLIAQLIAFYGLSKKAAEEMVEAQITIGNIKVVE